MAYEQIGVIGSGPPRLYAGGTHDWLLPSERKDISLLTRISPPLDSCQRAKDWQLILTHTACSCQLLPPLRQAQGKALLGNLCLALVGEGQGMAYEQIGVIGSGPPRLYAGGNHDWLLPSERKDISLLTRIRPPLDSCQRGQRLVANIDAYSM